MPLRKILNESFVAVRLVALVAVRMIGGEQPDSSRQYIAKEVIVSATRLPQDYSRSPSSVTIIGSDRIDEIGEGSVAAALRNSPGVFIKDYGSSSGIKLISQRGLGSEHTVVLLNGQRVSVFQNGLVDLGLLPTDELEKVEVIRGGESALFGADAVAGVVNLVTRRPGLDSSFRASGAMGSFGSQRLQLHGGASRGRWGFGGGFTQERSTENFPYRFHNGNLTFDLSRVNADFESKSGYLESAVTLGDNHDLSAYASSYTSGRGVAGQIVSPASASRARQTDKDNIFQISYRNVNRSSTSIFTGIQFHHFYERYQDPDILVANVPVDNYFANREVRFEPRAECSLNPSFRLTCGTELVKTVAEGNSVRGTYSRSQAGIYVASENSIPIGTGPIEKITVYPALRFDAFSSSVNATSPQCGVVAEFRESAVGSIEHIRPVLRLTVGRNFRMPTFNELFYAGEGGRGNPDLNPERATNMDVGGNVSWLFFAEHFLQASYYLIDMTDRILWLPAGGLGVTPNNIAKVRSEGFEIFYRMTLFEDLLRFETNYTNGSSTKLSADQPGDPSYNKQLIYIPQEMLNISISSTLHPDISFIQGVGAYVAGQFIGYRFYSTDNTSYLPSYSIASLGLRLRALVGGMGILARCNVENVFDKDYQVIIGYPMPMRSYRITVGAEF